MESFRQGLREHGWVEGQTIRPIIMFAAGDPVAKRIVASLARPGGNVTGLATISSALSGKRLQWLREAIPKAKRIAVLVNPANPSHPVALHGAEDAARKLGGFNLKWSSIEGGTI